MARGRSLYSSSDTFQLSEMSFYHVARIFATSSVFGVVCMVDADAICCRQHFRTFFHLLSLVLLKFTLIMRNFRVFLLFMEISISIFIFLIFDFYSWLLYEVLICFQFYFSISICDILFF